MCCSRRGRRRDRRLTEKIAEALRCGDNADERARIVAQAACKRNCRRMNTLNEAPLNARVKTGGENQEHRFVAP